MGHQHGAGHDVESSIRCLFFLYIKSVHIVHVVVNFLSQLIFIFPLFFGMVMYAYEFETKEK